MATDKKNTVQKNTPQSQPGKVRTGTGAKSQPRAAQPELQRSFTKSKYFIPAVLFVLCLLLYGNTILNDYALDDEIVTFKNEYIIKGLSDIKYIFDRGSLYGWSQTTYVQQYRPLMLLSFMTESSLFGLNPHVSHFINILLFAITVVLLYLFLQRILKNYNHAIILAATLLFAFHPIHTEVVANIKSRDEIMGLLFGLISFYYLMRHQQEKKNSYYYLSLTSFFIALFCKESCLTYIAIIPMLLYFFSPLEIKKIAIRTIPYLVLVGVYMFIRSRVLQSMTFESKIGPMDNSLMAAKNSADMAATSFVFLGKYIYMTIIPYPLSYDYSFNQIHNVSWWNIMPILSLLVTAALIGYMLWGIKRKSVFSFLIALFFLTLFLSSNLIVKIAASFAERFLYVPSLSFCIALPIVMAGALKLNPRQLIWQNKTKFYIPVACILAVYTIIVIPRNAVWRNDATLFYSGVITAPNSARTHRFLEFQYADSAMGYKDTAKMRHYYALAIHETRRALEITGYTAADWLSDLGNYYKNEGYTDSAITVFKQALKIQPGFSLVANSLGVAYFNKHQFDSALVYFLVSYKTDPNNTEALMNIGASYQYERKYALAAHYDSLVLKASPDKKQALTNLSHLYNEVAIQYLNNNNLDEALAIFHTALVCDSSSANAYGNIGIVYMKMGDTEKARIYYEKALTVDPKNQLFTQYLKMLNASGK